MTTLEPRDISLETPMKLGEGRSRLLVLTGDTATGKSVAATSLALVTAAHGGSVLWIDPIGGPHYTGEEIPKNIEVVVPQDLSFEFTAAPFVEMARGKTLVVIDHAARSKGLVAQAHELADRASVRVLVTVG
jgi:hypothetical protein